jgi:chemotaxis methyl-accepting protein methylase
LAIFATDLEKKNLQQARKAVYPASSMEEVKLGILKKYFKPEAESYRLLPGIRNLVNFSVYDLLDAGNFAPPESVFGDFDIILCRNVLIYYQPDYQAKIFYKLHRSLSPGGYLVLGETESLPEAYAGKFRELHRIARIYQKL